MSEDLKEKRILIVDDTKENIDVLGEILSEYKRSIALSGEKALKFVSKNKPDLILLDIMMPEMDGFEVCKQLKSDESTRDIPVIFITAKNQVEDEMKGLELGAIDFIHKPISPPLVLARVKNHLELQNARKILEKKNQELENTLNELKNTQMELGKTLEAEQELVRMKDKLLSIIGHDLRGPIGTFMMMLETITDEANQFSEEKIHGYLIKMKGAAKNTYQLLENLLTWARSQRNLIEYNPANLKIINIVEPNIKVLYETAKNKFITLSHEIEPDTIAFFDENSVSAVIRNLISNSLKFTEKEGKITVFGAKNEGFFQISIKDTGIGMSEDNLKKLFKQDQIFSKIGTSGEKGSGLGLLLCKDFVEGNGGKIWVESEVGKGTTFHFTLPLTNKMKNIS